MHCATFQRVIPAPGSTSILIAYFWLFSIAEMHRPTYHPPSEMTGYACFIPEDIAPKHRYWIDSNTTYTYEINV